MMAANSEEKNEQTTESNTKKKSKKLKDEITCTACNITQPFDTLAVAEAHFSSKKHTARTFKIVKSADNAINICELGQLSSQDILSHFVKFGPIQCLAVGRNHNNEKGFKFAVIFFASKESREAALQLGRQIIGVTSVRVRKHFAKPGQTLPEQSKDDSDKINYQNVEVALSAVSSVADQVEALILALQLTDEDIRNRVSICENLQRTLFRDLEPIRVKGLQENYAKNVVVYPFGSSVNGLGFRGCDLDIYVELPPYFTEKQDISFYQKIQKEKVVQCTRVLRKMSDIVSMVHAIPTARVPIVKFHHIKSKIDCDLSFRNRMSVKNTRFIEFYLTTDPRIRPLLMALRYWAKRAELCGGGNQITNYALVLVTFFFLQKEGIIDSVRKNQKRMQPEESVFEEGWETGFSAAGPKKSKNPNSKSVAELLASFFHFYAKFDFQTQVISPYLGKTLPKSLFASGQVDQLELYMSSMSRKDFVPFKISPICVQDPFEQNRNITGSLTDVFLQNFQWVCECSSKIMNKIREEEETSKGSLLLLFNLPKFSLKANNKKERPKNEARITFFSKYEKHFKGLVGDEINEESEPMDKFVLLIRKLVAKILSEAFLIDLAAPTPEETAMNSNTKVSEDPRTKLMAGLNVDVKSINEIEADLPRAVALSPKCEEDTEMTECLKRNHSSDSSSEETQQLKKKKKKDEKKIIKLDEAREVECRCFFPTWDCRMKAKSMLNNQDQKSLGILEREAKVSRYIVDKILGNEKVRLENPDLVFCYKIDKADKAKDDEEEAFDEVAIQFSVKVSRGKNFAPAFQFFKEKIPKLCLEILNQDLIDIV